MCVVSCFYNPLLISMLFDPTHPTSAFELSYTLLTDWNDPVAVWIDPVENSIKFAVNEK